jgi:hypothetical protein
MECILAVALWWLLALWSLRMYPLTLWWLVYRRGLSKRLQGTLFQQACLCISS